MENKQQTSIRFLNISNSEWLTEEILKSKFEAEPSFSNEGRGKGEWLAYEYHSLRRFAEVEHKKVLRTFRPEVIVHRSDEKLRHRSKNYRFAKVVVRDYFNPNLLKCKVFFIPCGFNEELVRCIRGLSTGDHREYLWGFVGNLKGHRQEMLAAFGEITPNSVSTNTAGFMKDMPLTDEEVALIYTSSHFVLCPFGSLSPDTWRTMEALEAGAIPVSLRMGGVDYFKFIFGDHPFIVAETWEEAAAEVQRLVANPLELAETHEQVRRWYREFTDLLSADLLNIFRGSFSDLESPQFRYQQRARWNPKVRYIFWRHFSAPRTKRTLRRTLLRLLKVGRFNT